MTDSNGGFRSARVPTETLRSLLMYLPGTALHAPRRNALVTLLYAFAVLFVAGGIWVRL